MTRRTARPTADSSPTQTKPAKPVHGELKRYKRGCRCEPCTAANRLYEHRRRTGESRQARRKAKPMWGLVDCLHGFGIEKNRISRALGGMFMYPRYPKTATRRAEAVEELHWNLWRTHGPFRRHCKCPIPPSVREWWHHFEEAM